jgi:hypothetical protein
MKLPRNNQLPNDISHFRPDGFLLILPKTMLMKQFFRVLAWIFGPFLLIWLVLTLWVQQGRPAVSWTIMPEGAESQALILYNPDPLYDLDAQLARAFSEGLENAGWASTVAACNSFQDSVPPRQDLLVIIANTYNWAPDWTIRHFIENSSWMEGESVVAITLGSGATERSRRLLEEVLKQRSVELVDSRTFWLLRPNDESRLEEPNVQVARELVLEWAETLGKAHQASGRGPSPE